MENIEASAGHGNMSGIFEDKKPHVAFEYETMSVGSRSLVQSTKQANEQSELRERVKRGMSKLWNSGGLGPIANEQSLRRDPSFYCSAGWRVDPFDFRMDC